MKNAILLITYIPAALALSSQLEAAITLNATIRDFKFKGTAGGHPDFQAFNGVDPGIVETTLPASKKPTYAGGTTGKTTGKAAFDMWYGGPALPGVDPGLVIPTSLILNETAPGSGIFTYINSSFFPIDGLGYSNQGNPHNFHFTLELHTSFTYPKRADL